jgi:hypothetical protein
MGSKFTETDCEPGVFDEVLQLVAEGSCSDGVWGKMELWQFAHRENRWPRPKMALPCSRLTTI